MHEHRERLLTPEALEFIQDALGASPEELTEVTPTEAGMTNLSFRFRYGAHRYILRVPGKGTQKFIDRRHEAAVYQALGDNDISDHVIAICPETGYKLTRYWENARNCDPENDGEVRRCMALLRRMHHLGIRVEHEWNLYTAIDFYEGLRGEESEYGDYKTVKARCLRMRPFLQSLDRPLGLTHVDAVPDNFLFVPVDGGEEIHLIDWEYAGMHDPHADIAMFAIYAGYDRARLDQIIDWYFEEKCDGDTRLKIYCYVALAGLLWSNWCEYKKALGVDFGEYARSQYRYASEFSQLFLDISGAGGEQG